MSPLSISQLTEQISQVLEAELQPVYWVMGELADFRQAPQGHVYFELIEKQGNQILAKIRANLWQFTYRSVSAKFESVTGTSLKNGMKVLAMVSINYHPVFGLSVNVKDIDPSFSLGERAKIRQETIDRLTKEGLIKRNAAHVLPQVIQKIAIISSATAAGYGDFVNQIETNPYGYKLLKKLYPSLMQGNEAVVSLLSALAQVEKDLTDHTWDAVVLIRGGGAQLDLDCFDDYNLAARISRFPIPVFTGIGHERDETIADLVAHTKLKTPTAVAEFLLAGFREFEENLGLVVRRMDRLSRTRLREEEIKIQQFALRTKSVAKQRVSKESEKINTRVKQIEQSVKVVCRQNFNHLDLLEKNLHKTFQRFLKNQKEKLDGIEISVNQLDPFSLLKKGYTRTESQGKPIHLVSLNPGDILTTHTLNQKINSTVTKIEEK